MKRTNIRMIQHLHDFHFPKQLQTNKQAYSLILLTTIY